jgi:enoyl-[acyl-carrier protein] reductase I
MADLLTGKKGLIMGLANDRSIAWGISQECFNHGADLVFSYQGDTLKGRVQPLAASVGSDFLIACDVTNQDSLKSLFQQINEKWGKLDFIVHAIAFSDKEELKGRYVDTSLANFSNTMNISCYSLAAVAKYGSELMVDGGSIITLSYYGAEKAIPNYNVMGVAKAALEASVRYIAVDLGTDNIRINAISAGPIRTLAASGISDFKSVLQWTEDNSPMKKNVDIQDIGRTAVYLLSNLSSGVTGEVIHVDSGYHVIGMKLKKDES